MKKAPQFKRKSSGAKEFKKKNPYLTKEWIQFRARFLKHNPTCYACGEKANVCDHLVKWKVDPDKLFLNKNDNFIPLCDKCHNTITGLFDQHLIPKTNEKLKWLVNMRLKHDISTKVKVISTRPRRSIDERE